jgi:hypothetical protein
MITTRPTIVNRALTAQEKEWLEQPFCLYDGLTVEICLANKFPPTIDFCRNCLIRTVLFRIEETDASASRWFMYFLKFLEKNP